MHFIKFATFLMLAGACLAFPAEEARPPLPPNAPLAPAPLDLSQPLPKPPEGLKIPAGPLTAGGPEPFPPQGPPQDLPQGPGPVPEGGKPENADLKTDSSFWWRRSYYPLTYSRYYYRPRSYTTYSYYPSYYSWWNPYSYTW